MAERAETRHEAEPANYDVIIIGAGVCGIYQLYRLLELDLNVTVLEAGGGPGGTWYWNRYPGCRFDSESWTYGYSFSPELLEEWNWTEHFSSQPETLRYLEHVVDKFNLRPSMQFDAKVERCTWDEGTRQWTVDTADGRALTCRFLMTALGLLSAPTMPNLEGLDSFQGQSFHTYYWPQEGVDLAGKRVGVIGTGATGVQLIAEIAERVDELTVFQRRPNWCAPLHNSKIGDEEMADIKLRYDEIFERCAKTPGGFIHGPDRRKMAEVPEEERIAFWEELYASPGFGIWLGNFRDVLMDEEANAEFTAFVANKIRERVNDPVVAEKLIPKDHARRRLSGSRPKG
jgi:cation diffusion facilitator CzcD-associated flavoprotein CzcO